MENLTNGKRVILGVTGCIGAYKAVLVLRLLQQAGAEVRVVMTASATEFVRPLTFQALTGKPVVTGMWGRDEDEDIKHIALARWADVMVVAPATANTLAKFAHGIADDFLSTLYVSTTAPVVVAPAMNVEMWNHPATRANAARLRERGVEIVDPGAGYLACGEVGEGRLAEPEAIAERVLSRPRTSTGDLAGETVLVTAGPTVEDIDPVRFLTNRSSGKMGYALAEAAARRGASTTLISGPTRLSPPAGVEFVSVRSTREMLDAVLAKLAAATVVVKAAAVCDYRPVAVSTEKLKKKGGGTVLELEPTEDILAEVGRRKDGRILVGFAAETGAERLAEHALGKLSRKNLDLIVANDVSSEGSGFDVDTNQVVLYFAGGRREALPVLAKRVVADRIFDAVRGIRASRSAGGEGA